MFLSKKRSERVRKMKINKKRVRKTNLFLCIRCVVFYVMWSTQCSFEDCTLKAVGQSIHKFPLLFSYNAASATRVCCCYCCSKPLLGIVYVFHSFNCSFLCTLYVRFSCIIAHSFCWQLAMCVLFACKQSNRWKYNLSKYSFEQNMRTEEAAILRKKI